jgi:hypothetical protein
MGEKMGERISPPNTWKHTTEKYHHFVGFNEMVLSSKRQLNIIFVRHLQLRLGII